MLTLAIFAAMAAIGVYLYQTVHPPPEKPRPPQLTEDQIKQQWRKLGFFCEFDDEKKTWTLTGSRAGLLYFPDLLLGYVADPENAVEGERKHFGPYGSLVIMTWSEAGIDAQSIRGSLTDLTNLAELVGEKLAFAEPGTPIRIRDEFAPDSRYTLVLDVIPDGFDPASSDRDQLGATIAPESKKPGKDTTPSV